jgi:hypothetical protein
MSTYLNSVEMRTVGSDRRLEVRYLIYNTHAYNYYDGLTGKSGVTPAGLSWTEWLQVPHVEEPEEQK